MKSRSKACELCRGEAFLYCDSDSAFLCWNCDARVHGANFLVARHVRRTICCICEDFDGKCFSGVGFSGPCRLQNDGFAAPCRRICRSCVSCVSDSGQVSSDSSGVTSVSVAPVPKKKNTIEKNGLKTKIGGVRSVSDISGKKLSEEIKRAVLQSAEGILVNWCRKLGLNGNSEAVSLALNAFSVCLRELTLLPFRVALASCFWVSLQKGSEGNLGSASTCRDIKRFANVCGVPVKLISMAEKKIIRLLKAVDRDEKTDLEEGWAECSQ